MTLADIRTGDSGTITKVHGSGALRRRLLDMGLTPKTTVQVRKTAPLGDPIELCLRNYVLSIRKADAALIEILSDSHTSYMSARCSSCSSCKIDCKKEKNT